MWDGQFDNFCQFRHFRGAMACRGVNRPFHSHILLRQVSRPVPICRDSRRFLFLFRRRPLYKPTTIFGRAYLRLRNLTLGLVTIGVATTSAFYLLDSRSAAHRYVFTPLLHSVTPDPEDAHRIAILALKFGLHPKDTHPDGPQLTVEVCVVLVPV
jgi:hypothetical protein